MFAKKQGSKFDQMGRAYKQVSIQYNCTKFYSFILLISCYKTDYRGRPLARPKKKSVVSVTLAIVGIFHFCHTILFYFIKEWAQISAKNCLVHVVEDLIYF